jgi:hypothetical protein
VKRTFLMTLVGSLVISALLAIGIIVFSNGFDETEVKILMTTVLIGLYSVAMFVHALLHEKSSGDLQKRRFSVLSIGVTSLTLVLTVAFVWNLNSYAAWFIRVVETANVATVVLTHWNLLLLMTPRRQWISSLRASAMALSFLAGLMILGPVWWSHFDVGLWYPKLITVLVILSICGTIVSPVLQRVTKDAKR